MKNKKETFADVLQSFGYRYDLRPVFDDFLTMTICAYSRNYATGLSQDENLYMETIAKYTKDDVRHLFPKMVALLTVEMEERINSGQGNDVLGDFYELNFCRKGCGQFFTPWPICQFMAKTICGDSKGDSSPKHILDPTCGSGRMLLATTKELGWRHHYHGIDIDLTCVKMTVLNLFLNGIFHAEVMCADALMRDDFRASYVTSFLPLGIYRIENKEQSRLWHRYRNSFDRKQPFPKPALTIPSEDGKQPNKGSQLQLF